MLALISAPSNLGLRPPQPGSVPGTAKAPEALREAGLHSRLAAAGAVDVGVVLPGRYVDDVQLGVARTRNQDALLDHARRLAARIGDQLGQGRAPLVLGGDCSLLIAGISFTPVRARSGARIAANRCCAQDTEIAGLHREPFTSIPVHGVRATWATAEALRGV
jgi:arginase